MKILTVGDPHVVVEELDDCQALLDGVLETAEQQVPDLVCFLGDMHHNHSVVRIEVTDFWLRNLVRFKVPVKVLLGNHDRSNDFSVTASALQPYKAISQVVDSAVYDNNVMFAPYYHDMNVMVQDVAKFRPQWLFCHQTFSGAVLENGFFAPKGIDPVAIDVPNIVSGHIHRRQSLNWAGGKIEYCGSPRWRTASDANDEKSICLIDTEAKSFLNIDTSQWCSQLIKKTITDLGDFEFEVKPKGRYMFEINSDRQDLMAKARSEFKGCKIKPLPVKKQASTFVSESQGVHNALKLYVEKFVPPNKSNPQALSDLVARRIYV